MIQNIFNPLEMNNSDFAWSERIKPSQAKGYKSKKDIPDLGLIKDYFNAFKYIFLPNGNNQ